MDLEIVLIVEVQLNWGKRYNDKLGSGGGVQDAVSHANSYIYLDSRVKQVHVVHHGNANMKIGKYRSNSIDLDERNILEEPITLNNTRSSNLISIMQDNVQDFNLNDYVINETDGLMTTNVNTNETVLESKYIDFQLKIGDFYTEAGYTVKIKGNVVEAIYDNNIDKEKQITALQNAENFEAKVPNVELNAMKQESKQKIQANYEETEITVTDDIKTIYYYDIANNKKYVSFSVPSITENGDIAYETVNYEI